MFPLGLRRAPAHRGPGVIAREPRRTTVGSEQGMPSAERGAGNSYSDFKITEQSKNIAMQLLDGHGFCQIPRLVHVAASTTGDVVCQQLQRNDLKYWCDQLGCSRNNDHVVGFLSHQLV